MEEETTVWEGSPSQILNLHVFVLCGLAAGALVGVAIVFRDRLSPPVAYVLAGVALVPIFFAFIKWLQIKCRRYQLTTERLKMRHGILSRQTEEVELYRIKDYILFEPLWLRMFGLSHIQLTTNDDANPRVVLQAVPDGDSLRDQFRKHVELCRQKKGVRITEFEG